MRQGLGGAKKERIFLLIDCIEIARKEREKALGAARMGFLSYGPDVCLSTGSNFWTPSLLRDGTESAVSESQVSEANA